MEIKTQVIEYLKINQPNIKITDIYTMSTASLILEKSGIKMPAKGFTFDDLKLTFPNVINMY